MKNILVCIKQVPDTTEIRIDPVKKTLIREGVPSIVNPFDAYALELAARIKDKEPGTKITLVSMGPPQAENALRECLAVGGDKAYLVSGREFGGSDTLATSYILSCAIKKLEELEGKFDIIFCGKQAIDGDTAQVGPEIAEHIGLPQVTYAFNAYGQALCAYEDACRYANQRIVKGQEIGRLQLIQNHIMEMTMKIEAMRNMLLHYAWNKDNNCLTRAEASIAKQFCSESANDIADHALQVMGGIGYCGSRVSRIYRDLRITRISGGTGEIQTVIASRQVLKKYK